MPKLMKPKSKLRNKRPIIGLKKRFKPSRNIHKKGVGRMTHVDFNKNYEVDDNVKLTCMDNIRNRAKSAMGGKRLTKQEAKELLNYVRYELKIEEPDEDEMEVELNCLTQIREMVQQAIKDKQLTENDIRKTLWLDDLYEKIIINDYNFFYDTRSIKSIDEIVSKLEKFKGEDKYYVVEMKNNKLIIK